MTTNTKLENTIRQNKVDTVKFCYYPFCDDPVGNTNNNVMKMKSLTSSNIKCILDEINTNTNQYIKGSYKEYGLKDTFVRSTDIIITGNIKETNKMCFRRQMYTTRLNNCPGIFVIELYTQCDEDNFPTIIDYPYYLCCKVDTYIMTTNDDIAFRICFTKIEDAKDASSKNKIYFSVCKDTRINGITDINRELETFFKDILSLKKKHNKLFCI